MQRIRPNLSEQVKRHAERQSEQQSDDRIWISTGSTLLDLAISGGVHHGGGLPGGILAEVFGPPSCGKTVLLCEIAGNVQHQGGKVTFCDPEARLNDAYAAMFGVSIADLTYSTPDTVKELFSPIRKWDPKPEGKLHGVFADSLAALTTEMEMGDKGDKMGMRRAKEFSQELRLTCRIIKAKGFLMVCSNQIRDNVDAGPFEVKWSTPGGKGIPFYASLRLHCHNPKKLTKEKEINGKKIERVVGVQTEVTVHKSSIDKPFRSAPVRIIFDYGIDDISANLQWLKDMTGEKTYMIGREKLASSLEHACAVVEKDGLEANLREQVIKVWADIEQRFETERKPKR